VIIFRCEASPKLGFGHLSRCRALAKAFSSYGVESGMVGPSKRYMSESDRYLFKIWEPVEQWRSAENDAKFLAKIMYANNSGVAVLDDYRVDEGYQHVLMKAGIRWLQFESRYDKPIWADWILYANPAAKQLDFRHSLRKDTTKVLVGPKYAILREEFSQIKKNIDGKEVKNLLIVFGGGDDRGAIKLSLEEVFEHFGDRLRVTVISGGNNPNNVELSAYILNKSSNVELIINPPNIAKIMETSDLAVTSGGTLTYEFAACNVPMIIVALTEDQKASLAWSKLNCAFYLGELSKLKEGEISGAIHSFLNDKNLRSKMNEALAKTVDGKGAKRVASIVLKDLGIL